MDFDKIFILNLAKKEIEKGLNSSQKRLDVKSNKFKNMDLNETTQRSRAMQRVRIELESEERNRWESKLQIVTKWIAEERIK